VIKKISPLISDSSGITSPDLTGSSEISFFKDQRIFGFHGNKFQVKFLEDNNPSTDLSANELSCQHVLK
jgi:hypothetical protein